MAVEIKDGKKILVTPISAEDLKDIHIGDIVYLTGRQRDPRGRQRCSNSACRSHHPPSGR